MDVFEIDRRKRELRQRYRQLRREMGEQERMRADGAIEERLCSLPVFEAAEVLLTYLGVGAEVRTRGIIERAWSLGKVVALPWCVPGTRVMRWYRVSSFEGLVRSRFGVEEPLPLEENELPVGLGTGACAGAARRMLAIVPALTFDADGYRLGYGGGFYDTFLSKFDGVSVGLCREAQISGSLCEAGVIESHDLPVQLVVTEERQTMQMKG